MNLLSIIFSVIDEYYFLTARLVVWLFSFASVVVVFCAARKVLNRAPAAFVFALLFATTTLIWPAFGTARNDVMPCFFAILALALMTYSHQEETKERWRWALAGLAIGIAVGAKASYAYLAIGVFAYLLIRTTHSNRAYRFRNELGPLVFGGFLSATPLIFYATAAWEQFYWMNVTYHTKFAPIWYESNGLGESLGILFRLQQFKNYLEEDVTLILVILVILFCCVSIKFHSFREYWLEFGRRKGYLLVVLLVLSALFALIVKPLHIQYLQPIIPIILFCSLLCYAAAGEVGSLKHIRGPALIALALVAVLPRLTSMTKDIYFGWRNGPVVARIHDTSVDLRRELAKHHADGKVATISPIRVIDAGLTTYKEFASGQFFFRSSDTLSVESVRSMGGASRETLAELFALDPPAAILTGYEDGWRNPPDAALEAYAMENGFVEVPGNFDGGRLFVRKN